MWIDENLLGLSSAKRDMSTADAVLDGIVKWRTFHNADKSPIHKSHIKQPAAERTLASDIHNERPVTGGEAAERYRLT
jgi:hypothetical protein